MPEGGDPSADLGQRERHRRTAARATSAPAENNHLFPDRPVKVQTIALDRILPNLVSASIGAVLVILGVLVTVLALVFAPAPAGVLGVNCPFTGLELWQQTWFMPATLEL